MMTRRAALLLGLALPGLALAQGGAQQGDGVGVPAAHPAQPPSGVILQRLVVGLPQPPEGLCFADRFTGFRQRRAVLLPCHGCLWNACVP